MRWTDLPGRTGLACAAAIAVAAGGLAWSPTANSDTPSTARSRDGGVGRSPTTNDGGSVVREAGAAAAGAARETASGVAEGAGNAARGIAGVASEAAGGVKQGFSGRDGGTGVDAGRARDGGPTAR